MLNRMLCNGRVYALAGALKLCLPQVIGHLEFLLKNAYDQVPKSGKLNAQQLAAVEQWAAWDGEQGVFLQQLLKSSLLVQNKRGIFFGEFWKEAPGYVHKRWLRKGLRRKTCPDNGVRCPDNVRPEQSRAEQSRAEKRREEKSRAEQSRAEQTREEKSPKDVVVARKTDCAPVPGAACSAQAAKLMQLLAEEPHVPGLMLLVAAGMQSQVAKTLCAANNPARVRQAVVYACKRTKRNAAGLIRQILENPDWKAV